MRYVSFDTETHRIQPGLLTPPLVCGSYALAPEYAIAGGELLTKTRAIEEAERFLSDGDVTIVGANFAYDAAVLANEKPELLRPIFDAYAEGRIHDVQVARALHDIALGQLFKDPESGGDLRHNGKKSRYNLDVLVKLELGRADAKANDFYRNRYALLEDVPQDLWPETARQYPKDDAVNTLEVGLVQLGLLPATPCGALEAHNNLSDLARQCETAFAMHLGAVWGIRTSRERVTALEEKVTAWHKTFVERFQKVGFLRPAEVNGRPSSQAGKEDSAAVKRAVAKAYGATGACSECGGSGRRLSKKRVSCIGLKVKNRFQGCPWTSAGASCAVCKDTGLVEKIGGEVNCPDCSGTGLDLTTAPTLPRTDGGTISTSRDTLSESDDPDLHDYSDNEPAKILETYLPFLREGLDHPINLRPNVLVESGRTSYDGPIQLLPRSGGVRECFEAREGYLYCSTDYSALELVTLAQVCLWVCGHSKMAETINESKDPGFLHTALAARMIGCDAYELKARIEAGDKEAKNFRQAGKPVGFGLPGGMGAVTLVLTNRKKATGSTEGPDGRKYSGIRFCILVDGATECGVDKITEWKGRTCPPVCRRCVELVEYQLKPAWHEQWPEMREYFDWVNRTLERSGGLMPCFGPWAAEGLHDWEARSHRVRGGLTYTNACNGSFQSLAADGAKHALRRVVREAYLDESSQLFGTRPIMFMHDEIFSEMPEYRAHLAGPRQAQVMIDAMKDWVPDVYVAVEPALCRYWYKDAKAVYDSTGKLIPWEPKEKKS